MHLAHRIDPGRVSRWSKLDLKERDLFDYRSKRHRSEVSHEDALGDSRLGNELGGKQLTGGCERRDARRDIHGRSKKITSPADNWPMVQPSPSER
ncbi:hypothetical protein D9M70_539780 [compost metagenome]